MTRPRWRRLRWPAALAALVAGALATVALVGPAPRVADACGGFFSRKQLEEGRRPSLAWEQALILHDETTQREHFIREVAFRRSSEPFGFVVPTPTRPEVARVAASPFAALRMDFPFEDRLEVGFGRGLDSIGRLGGTGVKVLEVKRVGSFTAYVLSADDDAALRTWLGENGFAISKEAEPWLRHYVARGFFYVALRHEPPAATKAAPGAPEADPGSSAPLTSETIRISFDTPLPYYPYLEPPRPTEGGDAGARLLEVWLVTRSLHAPVAAHTREGVTRWTRPMAEGQRHAPAKREKLLAALAAEKGLLGDGDQVVQRFMDQKRSRAGYGDVVFIPREARPADAARRATLKRLASTLDPSLIEGTP